MHMDVDASMGEWVAYLWQHPWTKMSLPVLASINCPFASDWVLWAISTSVLEFWLTCPRFLQNISQHSSLFLGYYNTSDSLFSNVPWTLKLQWVIDIHVLLRLQWLSFSTLTSYESHWEKKLLWTRLRKYMAISINDLEAIWQTIVSVTPRSSPSSTVHDLPNQGLLTKFILNQFLKHELSPMNQTSC